MGLLDRLSVRKRHHERSPEERALVRKLDMFLMTFGCISQIMKYLDQTNITNAYVSGMKEDLHLFGNELNYFTTYFNIGYLLMVIPSQIALTYIRPSWWLPGLEIAWGLMTGLLAVVQNPQHVYALRFFLGVFESSAWPGMMTMLIHWYTPSEVAKRMGIYQSCQAFGSMLSGALAISVVNTMNGRNGLAGWRWLFIIESIITVILGLLGFFMMPDLPHKPNPWAFWFKPTDGDLSMQRLRRYGKLEPQKITLKTVKRSLTGWAFYAVVLLYIASNLANYGVWFFAVFLKSLTNPDGTPRWNVSEVNAIPIGGSAVSVAALWTMAIISDLFQTRWAILMGQVVVGLLASIYMTVWTNNPGSTPIGGAYASFFILYLTTGMAMILTAWLSEILPHDPDSVTFIIGACVCLYFAMTAWSQVYIWPASQAPYYWVGWASSVGIWVLVMILIVALVLVDRKYLKPQRDAYKAALESANGEESDKVSASEPTVQDGQPQMTEK